MHALEPKKYKIFIDDARKRAIKSWKVVAKFMENHSDIFKWERPDAAFLSFPKYNFNMKSWDLCEKLSSPPYKIRVLPGIDYGYERHLRLGIGPNKPEYIREGLERFDDFLETI
jgi:aspartate/methionine/tyrosine aminotransferase